MSKFIYNDYGNNFSEHNQADVSTHFTTLPEDIIFKKKPDYKCVEFKFNTLYTNYFIGIDWVIKKEKAIYVEPKLNDGNKQTDYLKMLFSALKHREVAKHTEYLYEIKFDQPEIEITQKQDLLTPLIVVQFLSLVKEIVRKGLKKSYYKVEKNLYGKIKGKVLVGHTIKQNILKNKPINTICSYDEFGLNGLENRLLKKALIFVQRYLPTIKFLKAEAYTNEIFNYINPAFDDVSENIELNELKYTKTNAFYKEYSEAIRLAKLILKRFGYNINTTQKGKIKTPPFWIDMSKLFELYVLGLLKDKYSNQILYGDIDKEANGNYGLPDFLLNKNGEEMIIDTKYKSLYKDGKYNIDDIRQLSGYARDKKVLEKLKVDEQKVVDCLIIYPDQKNGYYNLDIGFRKYPIESFTQFYRLGINLPEIPYNNQ
jgi:5-methylcytosine-specific restriction enzyme subunit McrC